MSKYENQEMSVYQKQFLQYLDGYMNCKKLNYQEMMTFLMDVNTNFLLFFQKPEYYMQPSIHLNSHEKFLCENVYSYYTAGNLQSYPHWNDYQNQPSLGILPNINSYQNAPMFPIFDEFDNQGFISKCNAAKPRNGLFEEQSIFVPCSGCDVCIGGAGVGLGSTNQIEVKKKQKLHIDDQIESIQDLLDILQKHPYKEDVECNIDLKALNNIQIELKEINDMIGLKQFKNDLLNQLMYFMQGLHENKESDYKHLVIYGPPGTGKTQIAKLIGTMYSKLGILKKGVFKKVTRNDLVAGYLGQTAIKTSKVIQDCLGGVLFIDEVYSLGCGANSSTGSGIEGGDDSGGGGDSFSKECIDTICEALSNYKDELMVIIAGYEKDVQRSFFSVNPGLSSRFIWRFNIDKYDAKELTQIFLQKVELNGWKWSADVQRPEIEAWFTKKKDVDAFKYYGRDMEQLFTYCKIAHGRRIFGHPIEERKHLVMKDMDNGFDMFLKHADESQKKKKMPESYYGLYL